MRQSVVARLLVVLIILMAAWQVYRYHISIETWIWHARHGSTLTVGNYVVPVPSNWHVENEGNDSFLLTRLDTDDPTTPKKLKWMASVMLHSARPISDEDVKRLEAMEADFLKKRGVDPVSRRSFSLGEETIYCMGRGRLPIPPDEPAIIDAQPVSWSCKSAGGLDLMAIGADPDLKQVWEMVAHIRKAA